MSATTPQSRVKTGIPWYVWLFMILLGGGVLVALSLNFMPIDPAAIYQKGLAAFVARDADGIAASVRTLQTIPGYEREVDLLQGLELLGRSRPLKAVPLFAAAAEKESIRATALAYQGQAMSRGEQRVEAVAVLENAIQHNPDDPLPHGILAGVLYELGAFERALEESSYMISADELTEAASAHNLRGSMLMDLERFEEAAAEFDAAVLKHPVNPVNGLILLRRLQCLDEAGQYEEALEMLEAAEASPMRDAVEARAILHTQGVQDALMFIQTAMQGEQQNAGLMAVYAEAVVQSTPREIEKALPKLRQSMLRLSRDADYFAFMAAALKTVGADEESSLYEENARQLRDLVEQYRTARSAVITNHTDAPARLKAGQLAGECGFYDQAQLWLKAAEHIDPSLSKTVSEELNKLMVMRPELVPLGEYRVLPPPLPTGMPPGTEQAPSGEEAAP